MDLPPGEFCFEMCQSLMLKCCNVLKNLGFWDASPSVLIGFVVYGFNGRNLTYLLLRIQVIALDFSYKGNFKLPCRGTKNISRRKVCKYLFLFQDIDVEVELTANHWGRFEMFLCPNNNPRYEATQSCFDRLVFLVGERVSPSFSMFWCFQTSGIRGICLGKEMLT